MLAWKKTISCNLFLDANLIHCIHKNVNQSKSLKNLTHVLVVYFNIEDRLLQCHLVKPDDEH